MGARNLSVLKAALRSMEGIAQQKSNNVKMKKSQILHLNIQSAESVLRKGSLFCIYGTVFTTLRHQSIYWLPKCAIKDVLPFPL